MNAEFFYRIVFTALVAVTILAELPAFVLAVGATHELTPSGRQHSILDRSSIVKLFVWENNKEDR